MKITYSVLSAHFWRRSVQWLTCSSKKQRTTTSSQAMAVAEMMKFTKKSWFSILVTLIFLGSVRWSRRNKADRNHIRGILTIIKKILVIPRWAFRRFCSRDILGIRCSRCRVCPACWITSLRISEPNLYLSLRRSNHRLTNDQESCAGRCEENEVVSIASSGV